MEWAGASDQQVIVPWTMIDDPESLMASRTGSRQRAAAAGAAHLDLGRHRLRRRPPRAERLAATRQVIDVSGDGPTTRAGSSRRPRDDALAKGITINGLPLMLKRPGYLDIAELDVYYRDCVIGGQGSFMIPVRDREQFPQAIRTKIILEIADRRARPAF